MKYKILLGLLVLLVIAIPVSAQITTEVDCKEKMWFWYDYTCHENEVQSSFDEVTNYINVNENAWATDSHGLSFGTVLDYLEDTFWDKINILIDNKLDEREARIQLGWEASENQIGLEIARIRAMRTNEFTEYNDIKCSPEGTCLSIMLN